MINQINSSSLSFWKSSLVLLCLGVMLNSCADPCEGKENDEVGGEFFTVEYVNPAGQNYLNSIYNLNQVVVWLDTTGGESANPKYELINPGYAGGKFGPFNFTERYINPANESFNNVLLLGKKYKFDYFFKKDTYGQDTLRVEFFLDVDECHFFWSSIRYFLNGTELPEYAGMRNAEIVVTE
ncbi:MAG: hypothetical protein AAFR61_32225 [Bacteroidota bacterium]